MEAITTEATQEAERPNQSEAELRVADFDSAAIQRLVSEVRSNEPVLVGSRYDRTHNRHNR
jgi:hypothetical protein